jgi:lipoprotein
MKMKNMLKKAVLIASVAVSCSASVFAYNTGAYDHAFRGRHFDPNAMVTMCTKVEYLPRYQITNYYYTYGDGTVCLVQVDRAGIVHNILVE